MADVHVVIYFNQLSQRARRYASAYQNYFNAQSDSTMVTVLASTASRNHDVNRLKEVCAKADECIVIGGDGSVNIVANAVALTAVAVTVIPLGTGNDFARSHRLKGWRWRMNTATERKLESLGRAHTTYFVNHVGTGLSVDLMRLQPQWLKQSAGRLSYSLALLRYLFGRDGHRSRLRHHDHWDDGQIVALGECIGGGIPVNPRANRAAHVLTRIGIPKMGRWQQTKALLQVLRGHIESTAELEYEHGDKFTVGDNEHLIELDGDCFFYGPV